MLSEISGHGDAIEIKSSQKESNFGLVISIDVKQLWESMLTSSVNYNLMIVNSIFSRF